MNLVTHTGKGIDHILLETHICHILMTPLRLFPRWAHVSSHTSIYPHVGVLYLRHYHVVY